MVRFLLLGVTLALLTPTPAAACSCFGPRSAVQALDADLVIRGRIMRIEYVAAPRGADIDPNWAPVEVEVEVTRSWLGRSDQRMVLLTGLGGGDCGYPFSIGADYVILLRETESGAWYASICQGIQSVRSAGSTISALGRGYRPSVFPVDTVRPSRPLKLAPFAVGYSVLAGLALLGLTRHLYRTRVE